MSYTRLNPKYETFNVTYASGVSSADVNFTHYERYGKIVHLTVPLALSSGTTKARRETILTIPSGYRPKSAFYFQALNNGNMVNHGISAGGDLFRETGDWTSAVLWLDAWYISE